LAATNDTFEDACVKGWEALEATLTLPDADDGHVVAAAMSGRADAIVTANVRDFPDDVLAPICSPGWRGPVRPRSLTKPVE
jgi:PIN domain